MSTEYGVSLKELQDLMEFRGHEAKEEVLKLGGVETITKKLKDRAEFEELEGFLSTGKGVYKIWHLWASNTGFSTKKVLGSFQKEPHRIQEGQSYLKKIV